MYKCKYQKIEIYTVLGQHIREHTHRCRRTGDLCTQDNCMYHHMIESAAFIEEQKRKEFFKEEDFVI